MTIRWFPVFAALFLNTFVVAQVSEEEQRSPLLSNNKFFNPEMGKVCGNYFVTTNVDSIDPDSGLSGLKQLLFVICDEGGAPTEAVVISPQNISVEIDENAEVPRAVVLGGERMELQVFLWISEAEYQNSPCLAKVKLEG